MSRRETDLDVRPLSADEITHEFEAMQRDDRDNLILRIQLADAVALLRDIIPAALARAPKSIRNGECFTLNLGRAFLSRLDSAKGGTE